jgi:hypothetical protein
VSNIGQLPIAQGYAGAMGGIRVYVYGLLHRSGFQRLLRVNSKFMQRHTKD